MLFLAQESLVNGSLQVASECGAATTQAVPVVKKQKSSNAGRNQRFNRAVPLPNKLLPPNPTPPTDAGGDGEDDDEIQITGSRNSLASTAYPHIRPEVSKNLGVNRNRNRFFYLPLQAICYCPSAGFTVLLLFPHMQSICMTGCSSTKKRLLCDVT